MNDLQIFKSQEFGTIRTTEINGEPYFVGKDVAEALGYEKPRNAIAQHVDPDDALKQGLTDSLGREQEAIFISESGVYALVFSSKLPKAREFKHWVTSEVLPTIRKHGAYATAPTIESIIANPLNGIKLLQALADEQEKRKALEAQSEVMKPKALFADAVAASDTTILVRDLAKILKQEGCDIGGNRLFAWLRDHDYLCKSGKSKNMPTQKSMELGLFKVREGSYINSKGDNIITKTCLVTGKGQIYFVNKFKEMQETA
ncbi:MAG: phage antirepressor KilAC domain-containing protein [Lactimicrobium sp.]|jgi:anti-repressor protein|uniref:phage antirepressor KilAC domain-containing protein n=1 Tax=Lactimicrobium sp. TaxID=2563780 RepID=UPI002F3534F5